MSVYPNTGCHAVLALLSEGYPPLEGRSPTRYSPVCHSTDPLRDFRVRLACVRHAASVDSEPGSNSHVKFAVPRRRTPDLTVGSTIDESATGLTRGPIDWLCVVQSVFGLMVAARPPSPGLTTRVGLGARGAITLTLFVSGHRPRIERGRVAAVGSMASVINDRVFCPPPLASASFGETSLCVLARTIQFSKNRLPLVLLQWTPGLHEITFRLQARP